jgi:hypothetical protein
VRASHAGADAEEAAGAAETVSHEIAKEIAMQAIVQHSLGPPSPAQVGGTLESAAARSAAGSAVRSAVSQAGGEADCQPVVLSAPLAQDGPQSRPASPEHDCRSSDVFTDVQSDIASGIAEECMLRASDNTVISLDFSSAYMSSTGEDA